MSLLREYIKQILLTEAMKTPADLPDDIVVVINADSKAASIYYGMANNPSEYASLDRSTMGAIDIYSLKGHPGYGNCGDAWMVGGSGAQEGFGPLLYDIAIEWATMNAGGIIADRSSVSVDAEWVWRHYMEQRSGEVEAIQLDDLNNKLTPQDEDNCDQDVPMDHEGPNGWQDSPLSKMYKKSPASTIEKLRSLGKLVEV